MTIQNQALLDIQAAIAAEVATGPDMTKAQGGGDREVAKEGPTRLRLVGYVETGKHTKKSGKGAGKTQNRVQLYFELSGKNHPPREFDGKKYPQIIVVKENLSLSAKGNFFKLFQRMNWEGTATHMAQLVGKAFKGTVSHYKFQGDSGEVVLAQLRGDSGYTIEAPMRVNEDDQLEPMVVDQPLSPLKVFFWNSATKAQWDSIFIDGEYEAVPAENGKPARPAKSKNIIQNEIKAADNFKGSKIEEVLKLNGVSLDLPTADIPSDDDQPDEDDGTSAKVTPKAVVTPTGAAATDVLNGIGA